jgi:hypothetical protein
MSKKAPPTRVLSEGGDRGEDKAPPSRVSNEGGDGGVVGAGMEK